MALNAVQKILCLDDALSLIQSEQHAALAKHDVRRGNALKVQRDELIKLQEEMLRTLSAREVDLIAHERERQGKSSRET